MMVSFAESGVGQCCLTVGVADLEKLQLPVADNRPGEAGLLAGQLPGFGPGEAAELTTPHGVWNSNSGAVSATMASMSS